MLQQHGIHYIDTSLHLSEIQSGNGQELCTIIRQNATKREVKENLGSLVYQEGLSIISTEMFCRFTQQNWNLLIEALTELGIEVKILCFVRSPIDYYLSGYNQAVKRAGVSTDLATYVGANDWMHLNLLNGMHQLKGQIAIHVLHYDEIKDSLFETFWWNVFMLSGIDVREFFTEDEQLSNRSLNNSEMSLLLEINRLFGKTYSTIISNFLLENTNFEAKEPTLGRETVELIASKHESDITWINHTFFDDEDVIQIDTQKYRLDNSEDSVEDNSNKFPDSLQLVRLIQFLLRSSKKIERDIVFQALRDSATIIEDLEYEEKMPDGQWFDNIYYIVKNPDVALSGFTPFEHFSKWGRSEGRSWRTRDLLHIPSMNPQNA